VDEDTVEYPKSLAQKLMDKSPRGIEAAKKAIDYGIDKYLNSKIILEVNVWPESYSTSDLKEEMKAFQEKRKPQLLGINRLRDGQRHCRFGHRVCRRARRGQPVPARRDIRRGYFPQILLGRTL